MPWQHKNTYLLRTTVHVRMIAVVWEESWSWRARWHMRKIKRGLTESYKRKQASLCKGSETFTLKKTSTEECSAAVFLFPLFLFLSLCWFSVR